MEHREMFENAQQLFIEGKLNESINKFSEAIEAGEKTEIAYLSRGVAYLRTDRKNEAIRDFSMAVNMNDYNTRAHFYRGIAYMMIDDFSDAITDFDRTIELQPENGAAFFARGTAFAQIGKEDEATRNIKTAITFSESSVYSLQETIGLWRTQFDKAMSIMTDKEKAPTMILSDEEMQKVRSWLDEEKYH